VSNLIQKAKNLRTKSTETEKFLWKRLRAKQIEGLKFRRQHPIGGYIVDFVCLEKKVVIECDGGHHALQTERDHVRDQWLIEEGYKVFRFWDNEILRNIEGVLEMIQSACRGHPPLHPLPSREGKIKETKK